MRVLVAGNSVALYVRPHSPGGRPYGWWLPDHLADSSHIEIWAGNSLTVIDFLLDEERLIAFAPDVVIFNVGIVECTPRPLPQRLRRAYVRGRSPWQRFWLSGERLIRRPIVRLTGGIPAMTPAAFSSALMRIVETARDDTGARVLCLGLPPTSSRVAAEVPNIGAQISCFDNAIRTVCRNTGAAYLDMQIVLSQADRAKILPDGIHFSDQGHALVAKAIAQLLRQEAAAPTPANVCPPATRPSAHSPSRKLLGAIAAGPLLLLALMWIPGIKLFRTLRGWGHR